MPAAVDRVFVHVLQHVVHPAHVPLVGETEAAEMGRPAHSRPRRRFLGERHRPRMFGVRERVQAAEERDRVEVLAAAVAVGNPFAVPARVVEIQHRRHRVDAQPVDVILLEPEERVRQQEIAHFVAAVVEDERAPFLMLTLPRILVLVERRAVESCQAVRVLRENARAPSPESPRDRRGGRRPRTA